MKRLFLYLLFLMPNTLYTQDKIVLDSLLLNLQYAQDNSEKVKSLLKISKFHWKNDFARSMDYSQQALVIATKMKESSLIAASHHMLGGTLLLMGDLDKGLQQYLKSLKLYEELKDPDKIIETIQSIGVLYGNLQDYNQALEFFRKAISLYNERLTEKGNSSFRKIYAVYVNIGSVYGAKGEDRSALEYYLKGLELAEAQGEYKELGVIYYNLAKCHFNLMEFEKAYGFIQNSLAIYTKTSDKRGIATCNLALGNYYIGIEEFPMAGAAVQKALNQGKEVGSLQIQQYAYQLMSLVYEETNQHNKSLGAYKLYKSTYDSLLNQQTLAKITQVKMQFEFDKKEKLLHAEQQRRELKYGLIISIISLGFVVIGFLYRLSRSHSNRSRLEKKNLVNELEYNNKKLTTHVLFLMKMNESITGISKRLLEFKFKLKQKDSEVLQKIIFDLHSSIDQDARKEFEFQFLRIHSDFYNNLQKKFPNLSSTEKKLAAFLKLRLSSKEIASITGQSTRSLEVARYRLRKKLGIANMEVNLVNFLSEL